MHIAFMIEAFRLRIHAYIPNSFSEIEIPQTWKPTIKEHTQERCAPVNHLGNVISGWKLTNYSKA